MSFFIFILAPTKTCYHFNLAKSPSRTRHAHTAFSLHLRLNHSHCWNKSSSVSHQQPAPWKNTFTHDWAPKNWCFETVALEKTLESPLDCKDPTSGAWPPQGPGEGKQEEWLVTILLTTKVLSCGRCWEDKGSILASWTGCLFLMLWLPPPLVTQEMRQASSLISSLKLSISTPQVSIILSATPPPSYCPPSSPGSEDPVCFPDPVKGAPFQAFPLSSITFTDLSHSLWREHLHFSPSHWLHKYGWAFSSYLREILNKSKMLQINARY